MVLRSRTRERDDEDELDENEETVYVRFEGESSWHELPGGVYVEDDGSLKLELTDEQIGFLVRKYADAKGGRIAAGAVEGLGRVATDALRDWMRQKGQQR